MVGISFPISRGQAPHQDGDQLTCPGPPGVPVQRNRRWGRTQGTQPGGADPASRSSGFQVAAGPVLRSRPSASLPYSGPACFARAPRFRASRLGSSVLTPRLLPAKCVPVCPGMNTHTHPRACTHTRACTHRHTCSLVQELRTDFSSSWDACWWRDHTASWCWRRPPRLPAHRLDVEQASQHCWP